MIDTTARYIGLRTYRYSPRTTRCSVGAGGAGVPRPSVANCVNDPSSAAAPAAISTPPANRTGTGHAAPCCQPVSHQGTSPATTPGATTRKPALPAMAAAFVRIGACPSIACAPRTFRLAGDARARRHRSRRQRAVAGPAGPLACARWLARWLLPDRHVLGAFACERLPPPPPPPPAPPPAPPPGPPVPPRPPPLPQPPVPERERGVLAAAALDLDVVRAHRLRGGVVDVERPAGGADVERHGVLARWEPAQLRDVNLDDEAAAGRQVGGDVAEAGDLRFLRGQGHDRVEDQVRDPEHPPPPPPPP